MSAEFTNHCPMCGDFYAPSYQLLLHHIGQVHLNAADFCVTCGIDDCQTTLKNYHAFKRHLRKKHRDGEHLDATEADGCLNPSQETETAPLVILEDLQADPSQEMIRNAALWILKLKEGRKLIQSATEEILADVAEICSTLINCLGEDLYKLLNSVDINPENIPGLKDLFKEESLYTQPFRGIDTFYLQMSYYRSHLNFVVLLCLYTRS